MKKTLIFVFAILASATASTAHAGGYGHGYGHRTPHCHPGDRLGRDGMCHHIETVAVTRSQRESRSSYGVRSVGPSHISSAPTQHISRESPTEAPRRAEVSAKCEEQAAKRRAMGIPSQATWTGPRTCTAVGGIVEEGAI